MKERVIEAVAIRGVVQATGFQWDEPGSKAGYAILARHKGKHFRTVVEILEAVPTPAEDWLEFSSRFDGVGKPPDRLLMLVKTLDKPQRRYFGRWRYLSGLLLTTETVLQAERDGLKPMLDRIFGACEYADWMLATDQ